MIERSSGLLLIGLLLCSCIPSSVYIENPAPKARLSHLPALDIAVMAAPSSADDRRMSLDNRLWQVAEDLRSTGVFRSVVILDQDQAEPDGIDVMAVYLADQSRSRRWVCGNVFIPTMLTLGLLSTELSYDVHHELEFRVADSGESMPLTLEVNGRERHGWSAFPMRMSGRWARIPDDGRPELIVRRLRADLLAQHDRLLSLAASGGAGSAP